jgi:CheY-like chemotaxis protein
VAEPATILCVDDEQTALFLRKLVLERCGLQVITVYSGEEALKTLSGTKVDLVLSDILMPSMPGTELTKLVKEKYPSMPVILISGVNEIPPEAFCADSFISKLDGPVALCERVQSILKRVSCTAGSV